MTIPPKSPQSLTRFAALFLLVVACSNRESSNKAAAAGGRDGQSGGTMGQTGGSKGQNGGASNAGTENGGNGGSNGGAAPDPFTTDNLLVNGDAEDGTKAWLAVEQLPVGVESYGADGYPAAADPGPATRGASFFDGANAATAESHQLVDLTPFAERIATGARFTLAGYLGGYLSQDDRASIVMQLLAADDAELTAVTLGGPDAAERIGATGLFAGSLDGKVPLTATKADVHIVITRAGGAGNDGYADNLSLILHN